MKLCTRHRCAHTHPPHTPCIHCMRWNASIRRSEWLPLARSNGFILERTLPLLPKDGKFATAIKWDPGNSLSILFLFTGVWHSRGTEAQNPASACPLLYPSSVAFFLGTGWNVRPCPHHRHVSEVSSWAACQIHGFISLLSRGPVIFTKYVTGMPYLYKRHF